VPDFLGVALAGDADVLEATRELADARPSPFLAGAAGIKLRSRFGKKVSACSARARGSI